MRESQPPAMNEADLKFPFLLDRNQQNDHHYRLLPAPRPYVHSIDQLMMMMASNDHDDEERLVDAEGIRDLLASECNSSTRRMRISEHGADGSGQVTEINLSEESSQEQESTQAQPSNTKPNGSSHK